MAKLRNTNPQDPMLGYDDPPFDEFGGVDHPYTQEWYRNNPPGQIPGVTPGIVPTEGPGAPQLPRPQGQADQWAGLGMDPRSWTFDQASAYANSRGYSNYTPQDFSYWQGKAGELYDRGQQLGDPNYARMRFSLDDKWTSPENRYMAGSGGAPGGGMPPPQANPYSPEAWNAIMGVLKQGYGADQQGVARRFEGARENLDRGRRAQTDSLRAQLADRGLLGQGPEATGYGRIEENLQGGFNTALRDAYSTESELASGRYMDALNQAVRMSEGETGRQLGLGQLALAQLSENRQWNQFIAQFGLDRDKLENDIASGNTDQYLQLLDLYLRYGAGTSEGYR